MSDRPGITQELRVLLGCFSGVTDFERKKFGELCDVIDSIHAALEVENERLREQANRPTQDVDEWQSIVCSAIDVSVAVAQMALAGERP